MSMKAVVRSDRVGGVVCLALLSLLLAGCSKEKPAEPAATPAKEAAAQPAATSTPPSEIPDDLVAPILRKPWKGDLDEMAKRRIVRVLVPFRRPEFFYIDGHPAGILQEAFDLVERELNAKYKTTAANRIIVVPLPTPVDKVRERMTAGYADIAAYGISITDKNKEAADFTIPTVTGLKMIVVSGPGAPEVKTLEELSGKEVWVMPGTRMKGDVEKLNARLKAQGKPPVVIREADAMLDPGDIMEMVNAGTYPMALMSSNSAEFWGQVFEGVKVRKDLAVAEDIEFGWAIQKGTPQLKAFLDEFLRKNGIGTATGNTVMRRYLKESKYIKNAKDPAEMKKFRSTAPTFKKYAQQYDLDALLLVAQGFQESRLDQTVRSPVGAVGIMQVMPTTAASKPVNIPNINDEQANIHAGVRLLHFLVTDYFNEPGLDQFNRTLFAIASYNAGPAKIARCRQVAKDMGYDPNKWVGNVEVAAAKLIGRETTQYVANIYKYYLAYRMAEAMQQRKHGGQAGAHGL
jgi:membrane-bound lytic murein transglycosylase MltF